MFWIMVAWHLPLFCFHLRKIVFCVKIVLLGVVVDFTIVVMIFNLFIAYCWNCIISNFECFSCFWYVLKYCNIWIASFIKFISSSSWFLSYLDIFFLYIYIPFLTLLPCNFSVSNVHRTSLPSSYLHQHVIHPNQQAQVIQARNTLLILVANLTFPHARPAWQGDTTRSCSPE